MADKYETTYYTSLSQEFRRRAARALAGLMNPACADLRRYLVNHEALAPGERGSFLADPVFESMFRWRQGARTLDEMSGKVLHPALVRALHEAPEAQRLTRDTKPYRHQVEAWEALRQHKSIVVTSGTSSGKTECYLVPILDDLLQEAQDRPLTGVRALFLYPLNALINSQRDRLSAWTSPFADKVRFSLYNGEMPETVKAQQQRRTPEEVVCRDQLREDPPPILVTNATMLEYMLVRLEDQPILNKSQGRLRWIVLDEAHSYLGSQAADVALLLRRVMHAFAVRAENVRFVATSATIRSGRGDDQERLTRYLADVTGLPVERICVIAGSRETPPLSPELETYHNDLPADLGALAGMPREERFLELAGNPGVRRVRAALTGGAQTLSQIGALLLGKPEGAPITQAERARTLTVLDLSRAAVWEDKKGKVIKTTPLLPLRGHFFHRTQSGLWVCINRACAGRAAAGMDSKEWPFGAVYQQRLVRCEHPACKAMVYPLALCSSCGTEYLLAREEHENGEERLVAHGAEEEPDELDRDEEPETEEQAQAKGDRGFRLLMPPQTDAPFLCVRIETGQILTNAGEAGVTVGYQRIAPGVSLQCRRCRETESRPGTLFRPVRAGGPFFLSVAIPALLEHTPPHEDSAGRPAEGRRTITFTDSRQGTARFAAQTQLDAERNYARSWIYHQTWALVSTPDPAELEQLRATIAALEPLANNPALSGMLAAKQRAVCTSHATTDEWREHFGGERAFVQTVVVLRRGGGAGRRS